MAPVATDSFNLGDLPKLAAKLQPDGFNTRAIHVGSDPSSETNAVIPPISLSTTYKQDGIGKHKGYEYTRSSNPNRAALEQQLASLESGGAHALAFASGSATTATVLQSLGPNAHVLSVNDVYGGTFRYMTKVAGMNQGLETSFIDLENETDEGVLAAIKDNTKLIWIESPTNPTLRLIDVPRIVRLAHSHPSKPLVLVDNTFASPFYISPLLPTSDSLPGVDLVMHSLTKYVNGHSDVLMGALILPARHAELHAKLVFLQNAIGAVPSAFDCWLAMRGAKTLGVRMKQHGLNALRVAQALEKSPYVKQVIYPGLASHPRHELAKKMLSPHARRWIDTLPGSDEERGGVPFTGMVTFRIAGGRDQSEKFLTSTRLFTLAESLGGVESLAELPEEMTHGSIPPAERLVLGITPDLIRLSVGIEEPEDLVADILQSLERACNTESPKNESAGGSGSLTPQSEISAFEAC